MKTSKTNSKSGKISKDSGTLIRKKIRTDNFGPDEEDIREKAKEIYSQRIERGEHGTAENDWFEAENYLRENMV